MNSTDTDVNSSIVQVDIPASDRYWVLTTISLVTLLAFFPLFFILYTHDDDVGVFFTMNFSRLWDGFVHVRRLQNLVPFSWLPYLVDDYHFHRAVSLLPIFGSVLLTGLVVYQGSKSRALGCLAALSLAVFFQNSPIFNLLSSSHFSFFFGICLVLASFITLLRHLQAPTRRGGLVSAACFGLSCLVYEINFLYGLPLILTCAWYNRDLRSFIKSSLPILCTGTAYLAAYYGAIYFGPTLNWKYDGTQISFSLARVLPTMYQLSISALPGYLFYHLQNIYLEIFDSFSVPVPSFWHALSNARPEHIAKLFLSLMLVPVLLKYARFPISHIRLVAFLAFSVLLVFLPNFLLALTPKYQMCVMQWGFLTYTGTGYSTFGYALFFTILAVYLSGLAKDYRALNWFLRWSFSVLFAVVGLLNDFNNHLVARQQSEYRYLWTTMDSFFESKTFTQLPEEATIFAPSIWIVMNEYRPNYWSDYALRKSGRRIIFTNDPLVFEKATGSKYFLKFSQDQKDLNQFLILAPLSHTTYLAKSISERSYVYSNEITVLGYSPSKRYSVWLRFEREAAHLVTLNGASESLARRNAIITVDAKNQTADMTSAIISSPNIDVDATLISLFTNPRDCPNRKCS